MLKLNKSQLTGNVTRDPELRYTGSGAAVLGLGVAIDNSYKNQSGDWVDKTCFVDVTVFGKFAESLNSRIKKGDHIYIEGSLEQDEWQDKNTGQKRSKISIKAQNVQLTQKKDKQQSSGSVPKFEQNTQQSVSNRGQSTTRAENKIEESDIPF